MRLRIIFLLTFLIATIIFIIYDLKINEKILTIKTGKNFEKHHLNSAPAKKSQKLNKIESKPIQKYYRFLNFSLDDTEIAIDPEILPNISNESKQVDHLKATFNRTEINEFITPKSLPLYNYLNMEYLISLHFGSQSVEHVTRLDSIFSTIIIQNGSNNLNKSYSCYTSLSCKEKGGKDFVFRKLGSLSLVTATKVVDSVSFSEKSKMTSSFLITDNQIISPFNRSSGVFGLGRKIVSNTTKKTLLESLYKESLIKSKAFSIFLGNTSGKFDSEIVFGGFNSKLIDLEDIEFVPLIDEEDEWVISIDNVALEDKNKSVSLNGESIKAVLSLGDTSIILNEEMFKKFEETFKSSGKNCAIYKYSENLEKFSCFFPGREEVGLEEFPSFKIFIGDKILRLQPSDYMNNCFRDVEINAIVCVLNFGKSHMNNKIVIGQPFFRKYLTVFSDVESKFGFGIPKNTILNIKAKDPYWYFTLLTLILCWGFAMMVCGFYFKKNLDQLNKMIHKITLYFFCRRQLQPEDLEEEPENNVNINNNSQQFIDPDRSHSVENPPGIINNDSYDTNNRDELADGSTFALGRSAMNNTDNNIIRPEDNIVNRSVNTYSSSSQDRVGSNNAVRGSFPPLDAHNSNDDSLKNESNNQSLLKKNATDSYMETTKSKLTLIGYDSYTKKSATMDSNELLGVKPLSNHNEQQRLKLLNNRERAEPEILIEQNFLVPPRMDNIAFSKRSKLSDNHYWRMSDENPEEKAISYDPKILEYDYSFLEKSANVSKREKQLTQASEKLTGLSKIDDVEYNDTQKKTEKTDMSLIHFDDDTLN